MSHKRLQYLIDCFQEDMHRVYGRGQIAEQQVVRLYTRHEGWMDRWNIHWHRHHRCAYAHRIHLYTGAHQWLFPSGCACYIQQAVGTDHLTSIAA